MKTIFIGNIDTVDTIDIEKLFSKYGKIKSIRRVHAKKFVFIDYYEDQDAEDAVHDLHGREFRGKNLIVELAKKNYNPKPNFYKEKNDYGRQKFRNDNKRTNDFQENYREKNYGPHSNDRRIEYNNDGRKKDDYNNSFKRYKVDSPQLREPRNWDEDSERYRVYDERDKEIRNNESYIHKSRDPIKDKENIIKRSEENENFQKKNDMTPSLDSPNPHYDFYISPEKEDPKNNFEVNEPNEFNSRKRDVSPIEKEFRRTSNNEQLKNREIVINNNNNDKRDDYHFGDDYRDEYRNDFRNVEGDDDLRNDYREDDEDNFDNYRSNKDNFSDESRFLPKK